MIKAVIVGDSSRRCLQAEPGISIMEILNKAGIFINAPCGGRGTCGKCAVRISGAVTKAAEQEKVLLGSRLEHGYRLACRAKALGNFTVWLPNCSAGEIETGYVPVKTKLNPPVSVEKPDEHYEVSYRGTVIDILIDETPVIGLAVDLGTTTLALRFFDLKTGRKIGEMASQNPQRRWGADVISRIAAGLDVGCGVKRLQQDVIGAISGMTAEFCKKHGISTRSIYFCAIAGNTVMQHLAAGLSPEGMAAAPFEPSSLFGMDVLAHEIGLSIYCNARVYFAPCVSAFVGGDIVAGLYECGFDGLTSPALLVDIGTNGESALFDGKRILCCSTAAGPAFEGAHISCGCASINGAVSHLTESLGSPVYEVIGGEKPVGICGSGLVDIAAYLVRHGIVDETGAFNPAAHELTNKENGSAFVVDDGQSIIVTQKDVREVQLAKSAVAAGIETLLDTAKLDPEDIESVFLAGGFGKGINIKNACEIGLLPKQFLAKTHAVGNTSLGGAAAVLLDREMEKRLQNIAARCQYIELAESSCFSKNFIDHMEF